VNSGFMSSCNLYKVKEMVTHLGTHLFIKDNCNVWTMLLITGLFKCLNCYKLMINLIIFYKLALHLI